MDALGLNILKLDHVKEASREKQRGDCSRPLWHIGLYTYIASQLIGSTIALSKEKKQIPKKKREELTMITSRLSKNSVGCTSR